MKKNIQMRFANATTHIVGLFALFSLLGLTGCDSASISGMLGSGESNSDATGNGIGLESIDSSDPHPNSNSSNSNSSTNGLPEHAIIVGSFNIRSLGRSKISKPEVVSVLVDIVRRFDVIAIQELRDKDQRVIPEFLNSINRNGQNYRALVGERQGYYVEKDQRRYEEQMVYIYDANRIEPTGPIYVAQDRYLELNRPQMHRSPLVAPFRCRDRTAGRTPFSFVLMNVHVDPDVVDFEFKAMEDIIAGVKANHKNEDDFVLLGDLNGNVEQFKDSRWMNQQFAAIPKHWHTNTRGDKSIDNIVFDAGRTSEFMNQCGVMNLMQEYNLSYEQAKDVSDHMPVWAVFSSLESSSTSVTHDPHVIR